MTVQGNLAFQSGALYLVRVTPSNASSAQCDLGRHRDASPAPCRRRSRRAAYATRTYTILSAAGGLGGTTFNSLTTTNLPAGFAASLSYTNSDGDPEPHRPAAAANGHLGQWAERQSEERRQRARQFLQQRRHAAARLRQRVRTHRRQSRQCAEPALGRSRDRRPAGRIPNRQPVPRADARSVRRWTQRRRGRRRAGARLCARARSPSRTRSRSPMPRCSKRRRCRRRPSSSAGARGARPMAAAIAPRAIRR